MRTTFSSRMVSFLATGIALSCLISVALLLSAFNSPDARQKAQQDSAVEQIRNNYTSAYSEFLRSIQAAAELVQNGNDDAVRSAVATMRARYKVVEFLVAYSDPEFVDDFINGAPLPALERNTGDITILEPEGLQVIDELAFAPESEAIDRAELTEMIKLLSKNSKLFGKARRYRQFGDREVFEALRLNLIRVYTLGLTGFDTPGSLNAIPEARISFASMHKTIQAYYPRLRKLAEVKPELGQLIHNLENGFNTAQKLLSADSDFESFDRLTFLTEVLNPLFAATLQAHQELGIETLDEFTASSMPLNYFADNLFSPKLLNAHYFTKTTAEESTDQVVALGKLLFFDPVLSRNNQRACASCHHPDKAFTDGMAKSTAMDFDATVQRNAPTLINAVFAERFFYDLRAGTLEDQIDHVVTDEREFHTSFISIAKKLNKSQEYRALFKRAFPQLGERSIVAHSISSALGAYVRSLVALDSPFDKFVRGEIGHIDPAVKRGFNLFMGKAACGTCHFAPSFNGMVPPYYVEIESEVLGVPTTSDTLNPVLDSDVGRWGGRLLERAPFYKHSFKTTTVRNIELTSPYMHNGAYTTLEEVLDFYNRGGGIGLGLDVEHQTLPPDPLDLSVKEQADIISFMRALTDTLGTTSRPQRLPEFSDPNLRMRSIGGDY